MPTAELEAPVRRFSASTPRPPRERSGDGRNQEIVAFLTTGPAFFTDQACEGHIHDLIERSGKNIELTVHSGDCDMEPYILHRVTQLPTVIFRRGGKEVARLERPRNNATIKTVALLIGECFS